MNLNDLNAAAEEVATTILLLGPGFVFLKALALSGGQHHRLQWEWVVWSVLASVPIAAGTAGLMDAFAQPSNSGIAEWEAGLRFLFAATLGVVAGLMWSSARRSRWRWMHRVYRAVMDSAWDLALDDASRKTPEGRTYGVEVTIEEGGAPVLYYGTLAAFGYERAKAEPWVYLTFVQRWEGEQLGYRELEVTEGLLAHRDQIERLRVIRPPNPAEDDAASAISEGPAV